MTKPLSSISAVFVAADVIITVLSNFVNPIHAIGSGSTLAVSYGSDTVCGIVAEKATQRIECYHNGQIIFIEPNISFSSISGGRNFFCGLRTGGYSLLCWDYSVSDSTFYRKGIYFNDTILLDDIAVGDSQICATVVGTGSLICWQGSNSSIDLPSDEFTSISSGFGFSCGTLRNGSVRCWGSNSIANQIENEFRNISMSSIVAGCSHACGLDISGILICRGNNDAGQLNIPLNSEMEYSELALGESYSCGIRGQNQSVVCWGDGGQFSSHEIDGISFERIVSGSNFSCGLTTSNFSVMCWGPGWKNNSDGGNLGLKLPLPKILSGPCVRSSCSDCGIFPPPQTLRSGSGNVSRLCAPQFSIPPQSLPPVLPPSSSSSSSSLSNHLLAFAIVGSVGTFAGICTVVYCLWTGICFGRKKVHNSVHPRITKESSSNTLL